MDFGDSLRKALAKLTHSTIIDAKVIREFNKELQKTLIMGDVDVELVLDLTKRIEEKALKSKPPAGIPSNDYITDIVYNELVSLVGDRYEPELKRQRILLLGLYGSGKTTTAAKLARFYQNKGLASGIICCDTTRPAAFEQLKTLAEQANVGFFGIRGEKDARKIVAEGLKELKDKPVIICDTGGRSALDPNLIDELSGITKSFNPDKKVLVISSDIGQVAGKQASEFNNSVGIDGVVVTKMDGSSKGGGALSATNAAKVHVMFIGTGEKLNDLEPFNPDDYIGSLLGIPNIKKLIDNVNEAVKEANLNPDEVNAEKLNFNTFYSQLKTLNKMGPLKNVLKMMGAVDAPKELIDQSEEKLKKYRVIIASMTNDERNDEKLLHNPSRVHRIALGSGTAESDVRSMIADFNKMKKSFNMLKNSRDIRKIFPGFNN
ncbi:signal recognition particle subunit SRP54 [Candidatus Mancarchaeum acidiphilum]|uniref:signal-recognition-particle GTPase n=1 Tax=Candidatus Mancarchaeum acidiphilum TaxID=1920749 RepID=A0A218NLM7_9ARCH|nr:signal recognition particle receptor subunit alpha [Candidatus Mancarchaeum acidiphilum]ASI13369.1 signal recognition particle subunit SRP54 [Candidatus Mancarchaeum acidiphilum]